MPLRGVEHVCEACTFEKMQLVYVVNLKIIYEMKELNWSFCLSINSYTNRLTAVVQHKFIGFDDIELWLVVVASSDEKTNDRLLNYLKLSELGQTLI